MKRYGCNICDGPLFDQLTELEVKKNLTYGELKTQVFSLYIFFFFFVFFSHIFPSSIVLSHATKPISS